MQQLEVSLQEMLDFREKKAKVLHSLRDKYKNCTIVTMGMNIPGPRKNNQVILSAFNVGKSKVLAAIERNYSLREEIVFNDKAGNISFFVLDKCDELQLKHLMVEVEQANPVGRLYDIDVYKEDGFQVSRSDIGATARKCFICGKDAKACGRNRTHSVKELEDKTFEILRLA